MVDRKDIVMLNYLKMVVKETFRMHPAESLLISHRTRQHIQINANGCKYDVFPETTILVNAFAIGRDPNSWKNPDEFYPERFEGSEIDYKGRHFELLPFGSRRRMCVGIAMGAHCGVQSGQSVVLLRLGAASEDEDRRCRHGRDWRPQHL